MKKTINIILVLILVLIVSSCGTSQDDVNKAKQNLGIIESDNINNDTGSNIGLENSGAILEEKIEEVKKIEITSLSDEQFLELDDISDTNLLSLQVEVKGKTLTKVDKIVVTFTNESSKFPVDTYKLQTFIPGSDSFLYRAFLKYETLDYGKNVYLFEAYSGDEVSKLQLVLNINKDEEQTSIDSGIEDLGNNKVYENIDLSSLPVSANFGTPVDLGNGKISYSDLKGLEIKKDIIPNLTCEDLTSALSGKINSWFFWNTCRPIAGDEGFTFFIIRLDGDNYIYEKHYYLSYKGIYGTQELEKGTGITIENIGDKNNELKDKNAEYSILGVTDDLFNKILK